MSTFFIVKIIQVHICIILTIPATLTDVPSKVHNIIISSLSLRHDSVHGAEASHRSDVKLSLWQIKKCAGDIFRGRLYNVHIAECHHQEETSVSVFGDDSLTVTFSFPVNYKNQEITKQKRPCLNERNRENSDLFQSGHHLETSRLYLYFHTI